MIPLTKFSYDSVSKKLLLEPQVNEVPCQYVNPISAVSFIGSTHSGKSTLIDRLLKTKGILTDIIIGGDSPIPTSSNITFHDIEENDYTLRLLDFEGASAGNKFPFTEPYVLPPGMTETQYCKLRRDAVATLPQLAYTSSDVIVYVANVDFSDYDTYYKKLIKIAIKAATKNVEEAEKPSLILISNRLKDYRDRRTSLEVTTEFLSLLGDEKAKLLDSYLEVKCIQIPNFNHCSIDFFSRSIKDLYDTITMFYHNRLPYKIGTGTTYNNVMWSRLFVKSIEEFKCNHPYRMSDILIKCFVEDTQNKSLGAVMRTFMSLRIDFSTNTYDSLTRICILMLGVHLFKADIAKYKSLGDGFFGDRITKERYNNYQKVKHELVERITKLQYNDNNDTRLFHILVRTLHVTRVVDKILGSPNTYDSEFNTLIASLQNKLRENPGSFMRVCDQLLLEYFYEFKDHYIRSRKKTVESFNKKLRVNRNTCIVTGLKGGYQIPCTHSCFNEKWIKSVRSIAGPIYSYSNSEKIIMSDSAKCPLCGRINFNT